MTDIGRKQPSALEQIPDRDPEETAEWAASLDAVTAAAGPHRASYLLRRTLEHAEGSGVDDDSALVVGCAATVEPAILDLGGPRVGVPSRLDRRRLHVVMGIEEDSGRPIRAFHVGVDRRLALTEVELADLCPMTGEQVHRSVAHGAHRLLGEAGEGTGGVADQDLQVLGQSGHEGGCLGPCFIWRHCGPFVGVASRPRLRGRKRVAFAWETEMNPGA